MSQRKRLVVGITGASGAVYGMRLLEILRGLSEWETHLVISDAGAINIVHELGLKRSDLYALSDVVHAVNDIAAPIASGAFRTEGMMIVPCSMKTLSAIAQGFSDNLLSRAADVTLKERRRFLIAPRETPLHLVHLRNMITVTEMGGIVFPPLPAFYGAQKTLSQLIDESLGRMLEVMGITTENTYLPWEGL